jgi:hypothetical protein
MDFQALENHHEAYKAIVVSAKIVKETALTVIRVFYIFFFFFVNVYLSVKGYSRAQFRFFFVGMFMQFCSETLCRMLVMLYIKYHMHKYYYAALDLGFGAVMRIHRMHFEMHRMTYLMPITRDPRELLQPQTFPQAGNDDVETILDDVSSVVSLDYSVSSNGSTLIDGESYNLYEGYETDSYNDIWMYHHDLFSNESDNISEFGIIEHNYNDINGIDDWSDDEQEQLAFNDFDLAMPIHLDLQSGDDDSYDDFSCLHDLFDDSVISTYHLDTLFENVVYPQMHDQLSEKNMRRKIYRDKAKALKQEKQVDYGRLTKLQRIIAYRAMAFIDGKFKSKKKMTQVIPDDIPTNYVDIQSGDVSAMDRLKILITDKILQAKRTDSDYIIKAVEDVVLLLISLSMCQTVTHMGVVVCQFLSSRLDKSILITVVDLCKDLLPQVGLDLQAGTAEGLKEASDIWSMIKTSKFATNTMKLISLLVAVVMCKATDVTFTYKSFMDFFQSSEKFVKVGKTLVSYVFDFSIFFIEKALVFFKTGDPMSLFYDDNNAAIYQEEYSFLISKIIAVESGLLHTLGITFHEYTYRLIACEEETKKYLFLCKLESERNVYSSKLTVLRKLHESLKVAYQVMPSRIKPLGIYLYGESGVGKSNLRNIIAHSIATNNPDYFTVGPEYIVSYNAGDKYMSEIKAFHQILILDDIANSKVEFQEVNISQVIIAVLNNEPRAVVKAAVEEKGSIYMNFNLVVGTGNTSHMNAQVLSNDAVSILRRFEMHIHVSVKPEFKQEKGQGIDSSKTKSLFDSVWSFNVSRCYKNCDGNADYEVYNHEGRAMNNICIDELLRFITSYSNSYYVQQTGLLINQQKVFDLKKCEHGSLIGICSSCVAPQDGDDDNHYYNEYLNNYKITACDFMLRGYSWYDGVAMYKLSTKMHNIPFLGSLLMKSDRYMKYVVNTIWVLLMIHNPQNIILNTLCVYMIFPVLSLLTACYMIKSKVNSASRVSHLCIQRTNKYFSENRKIMLLGVACVSLYALKTMYSMCGESKFDLQGGVLTHMREVDATPNVWLKPELVAPPVDPRCSTMTLSQTINVVNSSMYFARFGGRKVCNAFPICANVYLVNWHIFSHGLFEVEMLKHDGTKIGGNFTQKFDRTSFIRIGVSDFALLYLARGGTQKNLLHLFPMDYTKRPVAVHFSHKKADCSLLEDQFNAVPHKYVFDHPELDLKGCSVGLKYNMNSPTKEGYCMSVLVSMGKSPYIAGFHSAGKTDSSLGVAQQLLRSEVEGALTELYENSLGTPFATTSQNGFVDVEQPDKMLTGRIHSKSAFNFQEGGTATIFGSHTAPARTFRSKVEDTLISETVQEVFEMSNDYGKPKFMNHWLPENVEAKAMLNTCEVDPEIMVLAHTDFISFIDIQLAKLEHCKSKIGLLSDVHNVSGVDGVKFLDRINTKSSTGWPYNIPKKDVIIAYTELIGDVTEPITLPQVWWDKVNTAAHTLAEGSRVNFVNQANKKDEAKKLGSEKVRIFYGTPLVMLLLMRRYTLTIAKFIMDHWHMFETTIGINVAGRDWQRFVEVLTKFGDDRLIAGDFEKFDTRMSSNTMFFCFKVIIHIAKWSGNYDEFDLAVLRGIATEVSQPMLEFFGDMLMPPGCHISGHSLTIIINGLANSHYMRCGYYSVYDKVPPGLFHTNVSLLTNGDDNAQGVSYRAAAYNHTSVAKALAQYGITYTMADKLSESRPYINLTEVSYLKRIPTFSHKYERYMPPLEIASLHKMLMNHIPSTVLSKHESAAETVNGAMREMFFHGEEQFNVWSEKLNCVCKKHNLYPFLPNNQLITYSECEQAYLEQY